MFTSILSPSEFDPCEQYNAPKQASGALYYNASHSLNAFVIVGSSTGNHQL